MAHPSRQKKLLDFDRLPQLRGTHPKAKLIHCHGVFDVLHAGHLAYFESAKKFGNILVVTLTADEYVNKGPGRPYFNAVIRANMLAALEIVDYVAISRFPTAVPAIDALKPDFYVKGPDYRDKAADPTGAIYLEEKAVEAHGGKLVLTGDDTYSSSELLNMFFPCWTDEQQAAIEEVKRAGGMSLIASILERISRERVLIVGEPIVDTYVFCKAEAISSKSPSVSAGYLYEENYAGGSLAIANQLSDFVKEITLLTTHGDEPYFRAILQSRLDDRVNLAAEVFPTIPTPRKTRFIAEDQVQRLFELTQIRNDQWIQHDPKSFCSSLLKLSKKADVNIVADFGHGLFEGPVLSTLTDVSGMVSLNVQTNSSNLAFNPYTKHKRFSYLSLDLKETRIAYQDRFASKQELMQRLKKDLSKKKVAFSMTLGPNGSFFVPSDHSGEVLMPAFTDGVVDALGAGDAFFALTSVLVKVDCPKIIIPFLGNVFAGLKTKILGHRTAVTKADLLKTLAGILK